MNRAVFLVVDSPLIRDELVSTLAELGSECYRFRRKPNDAAQRLNGQRSAWEDAVIATSS